MLDIAGTTRLYVVIGDPVEQVRAPASLNSLFERLGVDAVLVPVHVRPADLAEVMAGLTRIGNLDGILVTVPHKIAVTKFADEHSPAVAVSGSANALRRQAGGGWLADNFDGVGFVRGLTAAGHPVRGATVALVGAGGAGSAIAAALLAEGVTRLRICDTDRDRADVLVARLTKRWPGRATGDRHPVLDDADIAVNATPLGMRPDDPLPFRPDALPAHCVVADIVMKPPETPLLAAAAAAGRPVHQGIHMLTSQLDLYRGFFGLDGSR